MDKEPQKASDPEKAGNKNSNSKGDQFEINPVTTLEDFEQSEELMRKEDEKENKDVNGAPKTNLTQKATKPDEPLEIDVDESDQADGEKSNNSNVGFPGFGSDTDKEDDELKKNTENILQMDNSYFLNNDR